MGTCQRWWYRFLTKIASLLVGSANGSLASTLLIAFISSMNDNIAPSMSGLGWDWRRRLLIDVVAQTDRIYGVGNLLEHLSTFYNGAFCLGFLQAHVFPAWFLLLLILDLATIGKTQVVRHPAQFGKLPSLPLARYPLSLNPPPLFYL